LAGRAERRDAAVGREGHLRARAIEGQGRQHRPHGVKICEEGRLLAQLGPSTRCSRLGSQVLPAEGVECRTRGTREGSAGRSTPCSVAKKAEHQKRPLRPLHHHLDFSTSARDYCLTYPSRSSNTCSNRGCALRMP
jgi:hypothetical protein